MERCGHGVARALMVLSHALSMAFLIVLVVMMGLMLQLLETWVLRRTVSFACAVIRDSDDLSSVSQQLVTRLVTCATIDCLSHHLLLSYLKSDVGHAWVELISPSSAARGARHVSF